VTSTKPPGADEAFWRHFLTRGDAAERRARRFFLHLPHEPRCRMCAAPFAGVAAPAMRAVGDAVNTTARLASIATAGEILVTTEATTAANLDPALERRRLELKGKQALTEVVTLRVHP